MSRFESEPDVPASCQGLPVFPEGYNRDAYMADNLLQLERIEADRKTIAERQWNAPIRAAKPQQPCDHGMFGDEKDQLELDVEMFMPPVED